MDTTQQILLAIGIGVALGLLYLVRQLLGRRRNSAPLTSEPPKMRPKGTSRPRTTPVTPPAAAVPQETKSVTASASETPTPEKNLPPAVEPVAAVPDRKAAAASVKSSRAKAVTSPPHNGTQLEGVAEEYPYADAGDYAFGPMTRVLAALVPASDDSRASLTRSLRNAGYYSPHAWHNFSAVRYLGIVLPLLLFGTLLVIAPEPFEPAFMAGLIIGPVLGWAMPALYIRGRAARRLREIENAMPDMLDLLNMCVSQGMTVPSSLRRVSRELSNVYPALSKELSIVTEQARVGSLSQGLTSFSARVDVPEVHSFASLLIQTERMGTSVSDALADYSDSMRETLKQRADEKANSATFKILFPTVLCLMPAVFLFLMGPALVELNRFFASGGVDALNAGAASATRVLNEE